MTRGLHSWMYGRVEMRGRIDTRAGLWPAFWTLGVKGRWPSQGEIDIMEYYRGTLLANAAWGSEKQWVPRWDDAKILIADFKDPNWSTRFHVWRMDWDVDSIRLYVDGRILNTIDLKETFNKDKEGRNPFRQPHYIILNLAVGGSSGGDPSNTKFPAKFEVDYVRVYKQLLNPDLSGPNQPVRTDVSTRLGGGRAGAGQPRGNVGCLDAKTGAGAGQHHQGPPKQVCHVVAACISATMTSFTFTLFAEDRRHNGPPFPVSCSRIGCCYWPFLTKR